MAPPQELKAIYNFLDLSDQIATAGQPTAEQFQSIKESGYEVVVNLALPTSPRALVNEAEIVKNLDMEYVAIPVEWENPQLENLQRFFAVANANQQKKMFVHCAANMRVSAFMYLYRILQQNLAEVDARQDLHRIWIPNEIWQAFIEKALSSNTLKPSEE